MESIAQTSGERRAVDTKTFVHPSGMSGLGAEVPARGIVRFVVPCAYIARDISAYDSRGAVVTTLMYN